MPNSLHDSRFVAAFQVLGFTPLEAEVYRALSAEGPASGYRVAQAVGKSIGGVYKTLEGLESKGAVAMTGGPGANIARAVPIEELLSARRREFDRAVTVAQAAIPEPASASADEGVYRLADRDQVIERARAMIGATTDFCLVIAAPSLADVLADDLRRAAERAVHVGLKAFAPIEIPGVHVALDPRGTGAVARGPGEWLTITSDARELLMAIFDHGATTLHTASWTAHPHLNWAFFSGQSSDFILAAVRTALNAGATTGELDAIISGFSAFQTPRSDAKRTLMARYRSDGGLGRPPRRADEPRTSERRDQREIDR